MSALSSSDDAMPASATEPAGEGGAWVSRENRVSTVLLAGRLVTGSGVHVCRVRNVSRDGMLIETAAEPKVGERVCIELRNSVVIDAEVRWCRDLKIGVRFEMSRDVETLLAPTPEGGHRPRAPRVSVDTPILVTHEGITRSARLIDLSQSGCLLKLSRPQPMGTMLTIAIPGLPRRNGVLRRMAGEMSGFAFTQILLFEDLVAWERSRVQPAG